MWRTPLGERTLQGAEARLIQSAIGVVKDAIELQIEDPELDWQWQVPFFDELDSEQKVVMLAMVGQALLKSDITSPALNAISEASVAVLYREIERSIEFEIDCESELGLHDDTREWRCEVLAAMGPSPYPDDDPLPKEDCNDVSQWHCLIEVLESRVLWDDDWELDDSRMDADPETAGARRRRPGNTEDYFLAIPPDPTEQELEIARSTIRELLRQVE